MYFNSISNMSYSERNILFQQIESERGRPLIAYITSSRQNAQGNIASDVIPEFCRQILEIPEKEKKIDILIISRGGDPIVSWRIISLLRERFEEVGVLIPYEAFSAATLIALGADEIIMHPFSNLGPVDPQLHITKNNEGKQENINFAAEDLSHYLDFVSNDLGVSDQEQKERAFELVAKEVGAIPIGFAKRSSNLALSLGEKLLKLHMSDHNKVKAISESLNKSFYHHGYPVGRKEAKNIGLNIISATPTLEKLMWSIWEDIEAEMECREPFNPIQVIMEDSTLSKAIGEVQQVQIPANTPPQLIPQILQNVKISTLPSINYEFLYACVESPRLRSEFRSVNMINAIRMPDLNININVTQIKQGWITTGDKEEV
ncbi:hypothetical protein L1994_01970 [Methanomicrobium antiquum]|uniref:Serine protease n=1 Tax=Methanomicrobium antiquum TaxID=487686 RepID=A0AAF0JMI9_9EURY|nr:hypothetical protein [Methanomicrobium antiquum]WFN37182.1 hypothetical protein L1994_01970 [Methanomicrobium antiquum]